MENDAQYEKDVGEERGKKGVSENGEDIRSAETKRRVAEMSRRVKKGSRYKGGAFWLGRLARKKKSQGRDGAPGKKNWEKREGYGQKTSKGYQSPKLELSRNKKENEFSNTTIDREGRTFKRDQKKS